MANHSERARGLLSRMTIKEKTAQMISVWLKIEPGGGFALKDLRGFSIRDAEQDAGTLLQHGVGEITRPLGTHRIEAREAVKTLNGIQRFLVEKTRLGIPALPHEECLAGVMADGATLFPAGINYGALWDPGLMEKVAAAIGEELASIGAKQGLAPVLDVSRDARWGRTEETFGEDPYLAGCQAVAYVRGLQGPNRRVLATLKHFAGHSFSEGGRNHAPVHIGERELNDVFLLPFEMAVKLADAGSVMPAYHDIDGEPSTASRHYVTEVLREKWGFDGIVVADYEAISLLYDHHRVAADEAEASALAVHAGMDIELPGFTCFYTGIERAIDRGLLTVEEVNQAVLRVLIEKSRLGLFEKPYADEGGVALNTKPHREIAREAAAKSIVLLKNDGMLPLSPERKTALIGPIADDPNAMFCGYSFPIHVANGMRAPESSTRYGKTLREALGERIPGDKLTYGRGCQILGKRPEQTPVFPGDLEGGTHEQLEVVSYDRSGMQEAVALASAADQVVLAVGDIAGLFLSGTVGEGSDTASLRLPGVQQELLEALLATGKPLTVVLVNGRPYNLDGGFEQANAVLEAWLPGQEGGEVLADILLGAQEPGGRLPVSIPRSAGAMPYFYNHKLKAAGTPVQKEFGVVYPFGHGLSYTSFEYHDFALETQEVPVDGEIVVSAVVTNNGDREGDEVVQLYVRDLYATRVRPLKELKGFRRVTLPPGRSSKVTFRLPVDMVNYTMDGTRRVIEPGDFELQIGSSSEEITWRTTVTVTGTIRELPKNWRMVCETEESAVLVET